MSNYSNRQHVVLRATSDTARRVGGVGRPRAVDSDARWPAITKVLADLREAGRCSVRVIDSDCGTGALLVHVAQYARSLGFTAVEARGIDGAPALITRARAAAVRACDPGIGFRFETADLLEALEEEAAFPADIVLWHGRPAAFENRLVLSALHRAGVHLIVEDDRYATASKPRR